MSSPPKFDIFNIPGMEESIQKAAEAIHKDIHQREDIKASRRLVIECLVNSDYELRAKVRVKMPSRDWGVDFPTYFASTDLAADGRSETLVIRPEEELRGGKL